MLANIFLRANDDRFLRCLNANVAVFNGVISFCLYPNSTYDIHLRRMDLVRAILDETDHNLTLVRSGRCMPRELHRGRCQ